MRPESMVFMILEAKLPGADNFLSLCSLNGLAPEILARQRESGFAHHSHVFMMRR